MIIDFSQSIEKVSFPADLKHIKLYVDELLNKREATLQSSGSTGKPKSISFTINQVRASAERTMKALGVQAGSAALVLPPETTGGRMLLYRALLYKMRLHIYKPSIVFNDMAPVDLISVTPAQWQANATYLSKCGKVLIGGGVIDEGDAFPENVFHSYGMTETLSNVALMQPAKERVFKALDGVRFSLSEQNTLVIHDRMLGIDGLVTNDVVELIDEQRFVFIRRADKVINSGGVKVHLDEWYSAWKKLSNIDVQLVGMADKQFGEVPVLLVLNASDVDKVQKNIKHLPRYWQPKRLYLVNQWAYTTSGKPKIFLYPEDISELATRIMD